MPIGLNEVYGHTGCESPNTKKWSPQSFFIISLRSEALTSEPVVMFMKLKRWFLCSYFE